MSRTLCEHTFVSSRSGVSVPARHSPHTNPHSSQVTPKPQAETHLSTPTHSTHGSLRSPPQTAPPMRTQPGNSQIPTSTHTDRAHRPGTHLHPSGCFFARSS